VILGDLMNKLADDLDARTLPDAGDIQKIKHKF
jgi:hypothetical protein